MRSALLKFSVPAFVALAGACYAAPAFAIPLANYAYVTSFGSGTLDLVTASQSSKVLGVSVGTDPQDIVIVGTGGYVTTWNGVVLVDLLTNSVVQTITVGSAPSHIVQSGTGLYVTNFNDGTVSVIDINRNTVAKTITVSSGPDFITASGTGVFVSNENGVNGHISIIDATSNTVDATITVGNDPQGIAVSGTGIYLAMYQGTTVDLYDAKRLSLVKTISVGSNPLNIAIHGTGAFVSDFGGSAVSVIDTTSNTVDATFGAGSHPYGIAFEGTGIYVTNENSAGTVTLVDSTDNTVVRTISVDANPYDIAIRDVLTDPPTIISPAALTTYDAPSAFPVDFFLPEKAESGTVTVNFNNGSGTNVTVTLNDTASANFTLDLTNISGNSHVASTTASSIPDGTYTVTLTYRDYLGNPTASVSHASVVISTPASSSSSSSSSTEVHGQSGGASAMITPAYIQHVAQERFGVSVSSRTSDAPSPSSSPSSAIFTDVPPSAWFSADVMALQSKGIIGGYTDAGGHSLHLFGPGDPVSFAALAKMIVGLTNTAFTASAGAHWYDPYIAQAKTQHLSEFTSASLDPNASMSRGAVIRTIVQAYHLSVPTVPPSSFTDLTSSNTYEKDIMTAVALGIISGDDHATTVRPDDPINRAEISKILEDVSTRFSVAH